MPKPSSKHSSWSRSKVPKSHSKVPTIHSEVPTIHSEVPTIHSEVPTIHSALPTIHSQVPSDQTVNNEIARWDELHDILNTIFRLESLPRRCYMNVYSIVYHNCTNPKYAADGGAQAVSYHLYDKIKEFLQDFVTNLLEKGSDLRGESMLEFFTTKWQDYQLSSRILNSSAIYLHRPLRAAAAWDRNDVYELRILALMTWKDIMFKPFGDPMKTTALQLINRERKGETINSSLLSGVISFYVAMGENDTYSLKVYRDHFEQTFLEETERFYATEAGEFIRQNSFTDYLKKVEIRLMEEEKRVNLHLHQSTKAKLINILNQVLITKHLDGFHAEFQNLIKEDKIEDLVRIYKLLCRIPGGIIKAQHNLLEEHIIQQGRKAIETCGESAVNPKIYVQTILHLHTKYSDMVKTAFANETGFVAALDKACFNVINKTTLNTATGRANTPSKSPELLAIYSDLILKKTSVNREMEDIDDNLNGVLTVFKYIEDKDVFHTNYRRYLAKRLVGHTSVSDDAEESMISKLKQACGYEYASKLQKMFQDMILSKQHNHDFKQHLKGGDESLGIDFSIEVCTAGMWPLKQGSTIYLPQELERSVQWFTTFYNAQYGGRKLTWLNNHAKGDIVTNCFTSRYTFQVSTLQMIVLLQYNTSDSYTALQLKDGTKLDMHLLLQVAEILVKAKLLTSSGTEGEIKPETTLSLFTRYKNKKLRVNINAPLKTEANQEQEHTNQDIEKDRKMLMEASIVRIMKARKALKHHELISEVITQLSARFKPRVPMIKKCIHNLIEREYLERDKDDNSKYRYLA